MPPAMNPRDATNPDDRSQGPQDADARLAAIARAYLAELESGRRPNRLEYLARHADLGESLADCLDGLEMAHFAGGLFGAKSSGASGSSAGSNPGKSALGRDPMLSEPLGDFRIVRELGRGGMGVVYEAVQLSLGRRVALKVLPFAAALDQRQLQRFKNEAQAAAQLHHTNIVPVYAVGSERGVHFYAMQLIEGQSLAALIQQLRRPDAEKDHGGAEATPAANSDSRSPAGLPPTVRSPAAAPSTLAARRGDASSTAPGNAALDLVAGGAEYFRHIARLMAQAAEAVDHAHQSGVVHRDIKPANLLIDPSGRVWVTDFGLAQISAAEGGLTQTGDVFGTLRYMSPEQATGRRLLVDHRTDVYSLGATLYELATLEPIFDGRDRQTLLSQVLHDEPRPPARVRPMPVELETIILKAVGKNPADRYSTAGELAADLHRFLDEQPILARRPTAWDRVRKWSRRHPGLVRAGVAAAAICMAVLVVSNFRISAEQARTQAAYEREQKRAAEAEQRYKQAREAVDLLIKVSEEELADRGGGPGGPPMHSLRKRLLEAALAYYQDFITQHESDPAVLAELEGVRDRVRRILGELTTLEGVRFASLLSEPDVVSDLQPNDEQRAALQVLGDKFSEQRMEAFRGFRELSTAERNKRMLELAREQQKLIAEALTPAQAKRLEQIDLQLKGPLAFQDTAVITALELTPGQRQRVREIEAEVVGGWRVGPPGGPGGPGGAGGPPGFGPPGGSPPGFGPPGEPWSKGGPPPKGPRPEHWQEGPPRHGPSPEMRESFQQAREEAMRQILALLTPKQLAAWRTLTGPEFQGKVNFMLMPPPGGAGGGPPPERKGRE